MPTDVSELFSQAPSKAPGPAPAPAPAPAGASSASRGQSVDELFGAMPRPPTLRERIGKAASATGKAVEAKAKEMAAVTGEQPEPEAQLWEPGERTKKLGQYVKGEITGMPASRAAVSAAKNAVAQFKADMADPAAEAEPLHGLKTAMDAANIAISPVWEAGRSLFLTPVKQGLEAVGGLLAKAASPDEAKKKGIDWAVHKRDVLNGVQNIEEQLDTAFDALGFLPVPEAALAGDAARVRLAFRDTKAAVGAEVPKAAPDVPVTAAIDHTMGFRKVTDNVGTELAKLPAGTVRDTTETLQSMVPHAEGYAKSFLERLVEASKKQDGEKGNVPIVFQKKTSGKAIGSYSNDDHAIRVTPGESDIVHTVVHEAVHANTVHMMDTILAREIEGEEAALGRRLLPAERTQIVANPKSPVLREIDGMIAETKLRAERAGRDWKTDRTFYGVRGAPTKEPKKGGARERAWNVMTPRHEFVAEVMMNSKFQEFLANSEKYASKGYKWKNMLNQLGMLISKHLGLAKPQEQQLLNQALRATTNLITMQAREGKGAPARHIYDVIGRLPDGETITRADIDSATRPQPGRLADPAAAREAKRALAISYEGMLRTFHPEGLGERAKLAGAVIASRLTELEQKTSAWHWGSKKRLNFWRARPDYVAEFLKAAESGKALSDPALEKLRAKYKSWGRDIFEHDQKLGFNYEERENYIAHLFEDNEGIQSYFARKYGGKFGDPDFIKDRSFNLYEEAVAAGFKPRFSNPEDIMLARQHASDLATMHVKIFDDLASFGLATRKIEASEKIIKRIDAEGKVRFDIEKIEGTKQPEGTTRWRSPTGDVFWVHSEADAVLNNAFLSKSLWADKGLGGMAFRGGMALKNALIPIRLAVSLFHPLHVAGIDMAAGWTRATVELLSGKSDPFTFTGKMLASGFNPLIEAINIPLGRGGWRVVKAFQGRIKAAALTEEDALALKYLNETGVAPEMSVQYRTNARENFKNALIDTYADFRQVKPIGVAGDLSRAAFHLPWAMISAMGKPIFEQWIPSLKAASAIKDAKSLLMRNPELVENDAARQLQMRRIGKSVDNRYGEMAYNKLFWKRWMKDLAVLNTLSLGWQLGFIREYGGGAMDLGQFVRSGGRLSRIRQGEMDKAMFVGFYTGLGMTTAGLMTWAMTGESPTGLDWVAPRTGETNPDGTPQRVSTMFYSREFAALYKHMQNEGTVQGVSDLVLNKGSGLYGLMHEWVTGLNGFGQEIRDSDGDLFQKVEQTVAYSMADMEPITRQYITDSWKGDAPAKTGVLATLGFTPAPKYLTETKTTADIKTAFRNYVAPKETPFEKAEYSKDYSKLRKAYQSNDEKYGDLLDEMSQKYELSGKDQLRIIRSLNSTLTPELRMFIALGRYPETQKKLLDKMTPEERDTYLPHANKEKVRNVYIPPEQR